MRDRTPKKGDERPARDSVAIVRLMFRNYGLGIKVWGLGFRVQGLGVKV